MLKKLMDGLGGVPAVAARMNVTRAAVYKWISNGKIPEGPAFRLAHLYGLSLDEVGLEQYGKKK